MWGRAEAAAGDRDLRLVWTEYSGRNLDPDHNHQLDLTQAAAPTSAIRLPESAEGYPAINLNGRWRVITCRDGIQWILQRRHRLDRPETLSRDTWRGRSYCRTREALVRCCEAHVGAIEPVAAVELEQLPERIEDDQRRSR
jgi:hypothetical protein